MLLLNLMALLVGQSLSTQNAVPAAVPDPLGIIPASWGYSGCIAGYLFGVPAICSCLAGSVFGCIEAQQGIYINT